MKISIVNDKYQHQFYIDVDYHLVRAHVFEIEKQPDVMMLESRFNAVTAKSRVGLKRVRLAALELECEILRSEIKNLDNLL